MVKPVEALRSHQQASAGDSSFHGSSIGILLTPTHLHVLELSLVPVTIRRFQHRLQPHQDQRDPGLTSYPNNPLPFVQKRGASAAQRRVAVHRSPVHESLLCPCYGYPQHCLQGKS